MKKIILPFLAMFLLFNSCQKETELSPESQRLATNVTKISLASCMLQSIKPKNSLKRIVEAQPQVMIWGGDNIYADFLAIAPGNFSFIKTQYNILGRDPDFQAVKNAVPNHFATWDDHDYGQNDGTTNNPVKAAARKLFCDFWGEPANSTRRTNPGGIYTSYEMGDEDHRVQFIMLDLRWRQSNHTGTSVGGYPESNDLNKVMMSQDQWDWLKAELQKPAKVRFIVSSLQFSASYNGGEAWSVYPKQIEKMQNLIAETQANGVVFLSGDVHFADISKRDPENTYPLYDLTSSGITHQEDEPYDNANRISGPFTKLNYGEININWDVTPAQISLEAHDQWGAIKCQKIVSLDEISF